MKETTKFSTVAKRSLRSKRLNPMKIDIKRIGIETEESRNDSTK